MLRDVSRDLAERARALVRKARPTPDSLRRERMLTFLGRPTDCYLCGDPLDENLAVMDHVHPESLGGDDSIENLRWACRECNRIKGQLLLRELIAFAHKLVKRFPFG